MELPVHAGRAVNKKQKLLHKNTVRQFPFFDVGTKKNIAFLFMIIAF